MALLGGNFGLWTLGIDLNLRRIELLGPHLPVGARVCWLITDTAEVEPAVNFAGFIKAPVEEGKSKTLVMEEVQEEMEWQSGQRCTVCHADMVAETPMELLMTCPVEEVRASLSRTKKDWEDWVKRYAHRLTPAARVVFPSSPALRPSSSSQRAAKRAERF